MNAYPENPIYKVVSFIFKIGLAIGIVLVASTWIIKNLSGKIKQITQENEQLVKQVASLSAQLKEANQEKVVLLGDNQICQADLVTKTHELENITSLNKSLEIVLREKSAENERLESQLVQALAFISKTTASGRTPGQAITRESALSSLPDNNNTNLGTSDLYQLGWSGGLLKIAGNLINALRFFIGVGK